MCSRNIKCIDYYLTKMTYRYLYGNVINYDKTRQYINQQNIVKKVNKQVKNTVIKNKLII